MTKPNDNNQAAKPLGLPLNDVLGVGSEAVQPEPVDTTTAAELGAVADMVARASREQLLIEIVAAFGEYRANGDDVQTAAFCALSDWDA